MQPNLMFVRLHTDDGLVGLGESFFGARAVEAYIHEAAATVLFAAIDPTPEGIAAELTSYVGYQGAGAETRGNGAIDIALWDLLGQYAGMSVARLLGGPVRDHIRTYNTCAGPGYVRTSSRQRSDNWGLPTDNANQANHAAVAGEWDDLAAFQENPGKLAAQLRADGATGLKVWPFDRAAERSNGHDIRPAELRAGIGILEEIRSEVGMDLDLMVELHGLWDRRCATALLTEIAPLKPFWVEDPMRGDAVAALTRVAAEVDVPIAIGETVTGRRGFAPLLEAGVVSFATVDIGWTGGLTEARKVASLADAYGVPIAPHDCTGPVAFACAVQLACGQPNGVIQETVRAFRRTWYPELADGVPPVVDGLVAVPDVPGHGVTIRPEVLRDGEVLVSES